MEIDHFITDDGSSSLRVRVLNETYHSSHGAVQESRHVFINSGLLKALSTKTDIKVFEVGFGTGLNAILTLKGIPKSVKVEYTTIELYPLDESILGDLNYPEKLGVSKETFLKLHHTPWNQVNIISPNFSILKINESLLNFETNTNYDLIYFDAFGPDKQPEMWSIEILRKCYEMLNDNGVFVTYSAKGQLKRDLKALGFQVESLPGPPGKYQMTRATKVTL